MSQKAKIWVICLLGTLVVTSFFLVFFLVPRVNIKGKTLKVEVGTLFKEPGYRAQVGFKNLNDELEIEHNIDNTKLGKYKITYSLDYKGHKIKKTRNVTVVDTKPPVITLLGKNPDKKCLNKEYKEPGFRVFDNYDGDLTDKLIITSFENKIKYEITDSSGNVSVLERDLEELKTNVPEITLVNDDIKTFVGTDYNEFGYKATDICDGDITDKVEIENKVNVNIVGSYEVIYKVTNKNNNETTKVRKVDVIERPTGGKGHIYLTFDDGPSDMTRQILDVLKSHNVRATFFVVNTGSSNDYLIKRAYDEGHTIALHSYSHNYGTIYESENNFFNDLNAISDKVFNLTGYRSIYTRFPGGSSNTVSRYNPGIMSRLANELNKKGYVYLDWNVDSMDAGGAKDKNSVYHNVIKGLSHSRANVVLMHDTNSKRATLEALPDIINYGKSNGFIFSEINENTPHIRHGINN